MRKLICKHSNKGIWMDMNKLKRLKALVILKAPLRLTEPPVDFNHSGHDWINFGGMRLYARYFGNNQWGFMVLPQNFMNATPTWNQHPLYSDWFKRETGRNLNGAAN